MYREAIRALRKGECAAPAAGASDQELRRLFVTGMERIGRGWTSAGGRESLPGTEGCEEAQGRDA